MAIVHFKNKEILEVEQEVANVIYKNIISIGGAKTWQCFSQGEEEKPFLLINLSEVNYIEVKK